jgi:putative ABC transport system substrate-binding protein
VNRRAFITLIGSAATWPLAARAQQGERMRRIGLLMGLPEHDEGTKARLAGLRHELERLGWPEGHNVRIDYRFSPAGGSGAYLREGTARPATRRAKLVPGTMHLVASDRESLL